MLSIGGIILCGGQSTRMGRAKAMLPFGQETMLERVVRLLSEVAGPIVVVAAQRQQLPRLPTSVRLAYDERPQRGPLEGLQAGLRAIAADAEAAYVTSCDVPLLQADFVRQLAAHLGENDIVVPKEGEFYHPLAAIYRCRVLPEVETLLRQNQLRPTYLYERCRTLEIPVQALRAADPTLATLANLNRPEDYLAAADAAGIDVPADLRAELLRASAKPP